MLLIISLINVQIESNLVNNLNAQNVYLSEVGLNNDNFLELYSNKQDILTEIGPYHAIIISRYYQQPTYVSAVISLEGMTFGDQNHLLIQKTLSSSVGNVFKPPKK